MLGGERQGGRLNEVSPVPSLGTTFLASVQKPLEQLSQLNDYIFPGQSTEETRKQGAERLSAINEVLSDPRQGLGQQTLNAVGNIGGSLIPTLPLMFAGGAIGSGISSAIGFGARKLALEAGSEGLLAAYTATQVPLSKLADSALSHYLPRASIAGIAGGTLKAFGEYKGFTIPEHFAEHYNAINNTLDASHAIEDWGSDNYGFLLGAAPLAAGYVVFKGIRGIIKQRNAKLDSAALDAELGKLLREHHEVLKANEIKEKGHELRQAVVSRMQEHLQEAEEAGLISPEMHEWYLDYLENPNDKTKVHEGGLKVLQQLQIPYDRVSGRVWNQVLSREGFNNYKGAIYDQAITNFSDEEKQLLSSYIIHNELDGYIANMRDNPELLMAIQGMTHNLGLKIEQHSIALRNFEYALDRELPKGLLKRQVLSQNNIFQHLKKIGVYSSRDVPYTIPNAVQYKLKLAKQIKLIESRKTPQYELKYQKGIHKELKKKLKELKLSHPADELAEIRNKLMPEGKLINDYKNRKAYRRLEDLSQVWPQAKLLIDRIHMENMNARQQGLNEILKKFTEMADSTAARLANPDSVKKYLNRRIENAIPVAREFNQFGINIEPAETKIIKAEEGETKKTKLVDNYAKEQIKKSELSFAKEHFEATEMRIKQLSENENALQELINCALGE